LHIPFGVIQEYDDFILGLPVQEIDTKNKKIIAEIGNYDYLV
jgi:hypothetical protein